MSPTLGNQADFWLRLKKTGTEVRREVDRFHGALNVSGKGFSHREHRFTRGSYFPPSTVIKKIFEEAQKENRDLDSEDVEELAKQTLLSTEDVEMWVMHLDSVKKRRKAGARKAADTRKQKSNDNVATAGNEFWCLCGGPESGNYNMIACDNPGCPIEWFHFECAGLVDAPSGNYPPSVPGPGGWGFQLTSALRYVIVKLGIIFYLQYCHANN